MLSPPPLRIFLRAPSTMHIGYRDHGPHWATTYAPTYPWTCGSRNVVRSDANDAQTFREKSNAAGRKTVDVIVTQRFVRLPHECASSSETNVEPSAARQGSAIPVSISRATAVLLRFQVSGRFKYSEIVFSQDCSEERRTAIDVLLLNVSDDRWEHFSKGFTPARVHFPSRRTEKLLHILSCVHT
jgi:hypothetical protein